MKNNFVFPLLDFWVMFIKINTIVMRLLLKVIIVINIGRY